MKYQSHDVFDRAASMRVTIGMTCPGTPYVPPTRRLSRIASAANTVAELVSLALFIATVLIWADIITGGL